MKNEQEMYIFEGPDEFDYRLMKIDLVSGKVITILPQSTARLQLRVRNSERELFFINNRNPKNIPGNCSIGVYNIDSKKLTPEIFDSKKYFVTFFYDISPDGSQAIFPGGGKGPKSYIAVLDIKNKRMKITDMECYGAMTYNYSGTKVAYYLPKESEYLIKVIDSAMLK